MPAPVRGRPQSTTLFGPTDASARESGVAGAAPDSIAAERLLPTCRHCGHRIAWYVRSHETKAPAKDLPLAMDTCRELSTALLREQMPQGAFRMENHSEGSGWDTGQQLFALAQASDEHVALPQ